MSNPPTVSMDPAQPTPASAPQGAAIGLKSGTKLGKYEIVGRLGLGGMAMVYKGYDPLLDRFVAIKQIASHLAADPKFMDRFRKEAQILAKLGTDQASVVQIYELIEDPRGLFIIMEYVEGQTLDLLITRQKGPMSVQLTLEVLWHLTVGLRAVHEKGIIHRDMKPANVLVGVNHRCKIMDFGVAARFGGKTSMTLGTTKYMAPELFGGDEVDGRVDIYSLGCMTYEMLCGQDKFNQIFRDVTKDDRAEALRWMKWHTNRELMAPMLDQVNPHVPEVLAKIVAKMMAKDPAQRFASAEHLLEILKRHFTQQGLAKKAAGRRTRVAAATAAAATASTERRPEPIPDRPAEDGSLPMAAPASVIAGGPPPLPVARQATTASAGPRQGPGTTRLPRRKMTRRQRIVVLSSVLGVALIGVIALFVVDWLKTENIKNLGEKRFNQAVAVENDVAKEKNPDKARQLQDTALNLFAALRDDPKLSKTQLGSSKVLSRMGMRDDPLATWGQLADSMISWIDGRRMLKVAKEMSREAWPTREPSHTDLKLTDKQAKALSDMGPKLPPDASAADLSPEQLTALIKTRWSEAEEGRKKIVAARYLPTAKVSTFERDFTYDHDSLARVDDALALMAQGLMQLQIAPIDDSKGKLEEAEAINKTVDLTSLFAYRNQIKAECEYRQLVKEAKDTEAKGHELASRNAAESKKLLAKAEDLYNTALKSHANDQEVIARLDKLKFGQNLDDLRSKAAALWKIVNDTDRTKVPECRQAYVELAKVDTENAADIANRIKRLDAGEYFMKGKAAMDAGQFKLADDYFTKALALNPDLKGPIDAIRKNWDEADKYASLMRSAQDALNQDNPDLARKLLAQASQSSRAVKAEIDKLIDDCRKKELVALMKKAADSMTAKRWAEAETVYNQARGKDTAPSTYTESIDLKMEEIAARKTSEKMLADGDAKLKAVNYDAARAQYQALKKYAQELQGIAVAPSVAPQPVVDPRHRPRGAAPAPVAPPAAAKQLPKVSLAVGKDIENQADGRIKDVDYARYLFSAKGEMDQKRWREAKGFLNMAEKEKSTPEVQALQTEVQGYIDKMEKEAAAGGSH